MLQFLGKAEGDHYWEDVEATRETESQKLLMIRELTESIWESVINSLATESTRITCSNVNVYFLLQLIWYKMG